MPTTHARRRITNLILILLALGTGHSLLQPGAAHSGTTRAGERVVLLPDDRLGDHLLANTGARSSTLLVRKKLISGC